MNTAKITAIAVLGAGLFVASVASAQYYDYSYQYPQTTYASCPNIYSNMTLGSRGSEVSELQRYLAARYGDYRLTGGYYGQLTVYYVQRLQQELGVYPATGGVGPQTRAAILRDCGASTGYPSYPGYPTTPGYPTYPSTDTFRLDRTFNLVPGQSAQERNGRLTVTLNQINGDNWYYYYSNNRNNADSVRITLTLGCSPGTYCLYAPQQSFTLEEDDSVDFYDYEVELTDLRSDRATFRVTQEDNDDDDATIDITTPRANQEFEQGDEMRVAWTVRDEPRNGSVVLELFTDRDRLVGVIAIDDGESGSYEWDIPRRNTYCTMQYPNGLCGHDLDGDYYIRAKILSGTNGGGSVLDTDDSPEFSIED